MTINGKPAGEWVFQNAWLIVRLVGVLSVVIFFGYDMTVKLNSTIERLDRIELAAFEREIRNLHFKMCDASEESQEGFQLAIDGIMRQINELGLESKLNLNCI